MLQQVLQQIDQNHDAAIERLCDFLRIESVSTDPGYADQCRQAAEWVADQLRQCGLDAAVRPTDGHPVVVGKSTSADDNAPHVLFYGHYDVQPPDPLDKWHTPPFEPTLRDGRIYARGASDDKGQVMCFIEALRAWSQSTEQLPINLTVLIEGEEEAASAHLDDFIEANIEEFKADIAVVSDTSLWEDGKPAITYALRGLAYFQVNLIGPNRDLHSGVYGGTVANPATELVKVLGRLFDDDHRVTIPGFYDDVEPLTETERRQWDQLDFSDEKWAASVGVNQLHGEAGYATLERRWARPSCDINGLFGGYAGEGAKTVIPASAGAKVSFRLAARQDPRKIGQAFRQWLEDQTPPGCQWRIHEYAWAHPVIVPTDSPYLAAASRAMETAFGQKPLLVREGATIPVVATFKSMLKLNTLLVGFGLNDDALHSPNEKFELHCYQMGRRTHAALIAELARMTART